MNTTLAWCQWTDFFKVVFISMEGAGAYNVWCIVHLLLLIQLTQTPLPSTLSSFISCTFVCYGPASSICLKGPYKGQGTQDHVRGPIITAISSKRSIFTTAPISASAVGIAV